MAKVTFLTFYLDYSIGVYVLSSILQNAGHDVSVIFFKLPRKAVIPWFKKDPINVEHVIPTGEIIGHNADVNPWTPHEVELLAAKLSDLSPDLLCISSRSTDDRLVSQVIPEIRHRCSLPTTIAGGFGPTLNPERYCDLVDYVFMGEAENAILDLVSAVEKGESLQGMKNICFKENSVFVKNPLRVPDVHQFTFEEVPVRQFYVEDDMLMDFDDREQVMPTHTYGTFVGRGCISSCSYCSAGHWHDLYKREGILIAKRRNRQLDDVFQELLRMKEKDYTFVHFRDEFLCADVAYLKEFFRFYEREICLPFWAYLVPDQVLSHPELLDMAVNAGFVDTELGFQSGSKRINRDIYTRRISNARTLEYARLLARYDINMKHDFIIFNPAEQKTDIEATLELIQMLPKERSYLQLSRLHYFPESPIVDILKPVRQNPLDFESHYATALLYLLCFVLPKKEFDALRRDPGVTSSWRRLRTLYGDYLRQNHIEFPVGTHEIPGSITTHRYQRILNKRQYRDVIVWGAGDYFREMSQIFKDVRVKYLIDDKCNGGCHGLETSPPTILNREKGATPIFVCSRRKQEIKQYISQHYPDYGGLLYV
ncbi:MAG: cobalamin-dependent protein [Deltaproteobacteria bacterium]|nr:cobalamin-dependent protein [Deltaproteobacteria bacterium]